jgi:hypothetical protein
MIVNDAHVIVVVGREKVYDDVEHEKEVHQLIQNECNIGSAFIPKSQKIRAQDAGDYYKSKRLIRICIT